MAKIKFENTYELLKHLYLKGILKGYYIAGPNESGSGTFPKIENTEIESIINDLFYEHKQISFENGDCYDSIDFDLKIEDNDLILVGKSEYGDYSEMSGLDLYSDLNSILIELEIIKDENEEVELECSLNDSDSFNLIKYINDGDDIVELKVNKQQYKSILKHIKESFLSKSELFFEDGNVVDSLHLTINSEDTSYFNDAENISKEEVKEFIEFMVEYGHFDDKSYEFDEDEIK